jgi:hypothetical protein
MKIEEREAHIRCEQDFLDQCAEILNINHEYIRPYLKRDRWNTRKLGNGRFPGFGVIRYHSSSCIMVMSHKGGTRMFNSEEEVYDFLKE